MNVPLRLAEQRLTPSDETLEFGTQVIRKEAAALSTLAESLDRSFTRAVERLCDCRGSAIVSGMGKAGLVGQKISATLASTGTRSHFLHPAEAIHGDLGRVHADDVVIVLSHSGRTAEILELLPPLAAIDVPVIAITGRVDSPLAKAATETLWIGDVEEAGTLNLAPSTSTTAMLALGDALALAASRQLGFSQDDFAKFHPGGALGQRLSRVDDWMRSVEHCRIASDDKTVREILISEGRTGRRTGAILLTDQNAGQLTGIFTDSDLARLLEAQLDQSLDRPICEVMSRSPSTVRVGTMIDAAVTTLQTLRISELPVIDQEDRPVGMIDITDMLALMPEFDQVSVTAASEHDNNENASDGTPAPSDGQSILRMPNSTQGTSVDET